MPVLDVLSARRCWRDLQQGTQSEQQQKVMLLWWPAQVPEGLQEVVALEMKMLRQLFGHLLLFQQVKLLYHLALVQTSPLHCLLLGCPHLQGRLRRNHAGRPTCDEASKMNALQVRGDQTYRTAPCLHRTKRHVITFY